MASAYRYELSPNQFLYLGNQGSATTVTLSSGSAGQQQQQSTNSFSTGAWTNVPQLYHIGQSAIVVIQTSSQTYYVQCQQGQVQMSHTPTAAITTALSHTQPAVMEPISQLPDLSMPSGAPMAPMAPMASMPPMQMNNNPMSMTLGNMSMTMGDSPAPQQAQTQATNLSQATNASQTTKRFCTQCGAPTEPTDKFCGACGNALS